MPSPAQDIRCSARSGRKRTSVRAAHRDMAVLCVPSRRLKRHAATSAHSRVIVSSCDITALVRGKDTGEKRQPCISPCCLAGMTDVAGFQFELIGERERCRDR